MMPWQEIRNVHAASGGGDMPADKNVSNINNLNAVDKDVNVSCGR